MIWVFCDDLLHDDVQMFYLCGVSIIKIRVLYAVSLNHHILFIYYCDDNNNNIIRKPRQILLLLATFTPNGII